MIADGCLFYPITLSEHTDRAHIRPPVTSGYRAVMRAPPHPHHFPRGVDFREVHDGERDPLPISRIDAIYRLLVPSPPHPSHDGMVSMLSHKLRPESA